MQLHAPRLFFPATSSIRNTYRGNKKRKHPIIECFLFLLGYSDSNQEKQDQNLLCYHYTIAQTERYFLRGNFRMNV